jgi:hypothetical protein
MSLLPGKLRALHKQPRQGADWYREPRDSVLSLFNALTFEGRIHDPCCGRGRIVEVAREGGYHATGSDLYDYGFGEAGVDFLTDDGPRDSLAFNAPYALNEAFIAHALDVAQYEIAALVRVPFLAGQQRYRTLFRAFPPERVLILSRRPSMPPGDSNSPARNGTADYCWLIWPKREARPRVRKTTIDWAAP